MSLKNFPQNFLGFTLYFLQMQLKESKQNFFLFFIRHITKITYNQTQTFNTILNKN